MQPFNISQLNKKFFVLLQWLSLSVSIITLSGVYFSGFIPVQNAVVSVYLNVVVFQQHEKNNFYSNSKRDIYRRKSTPHHLSCRSFYLNTSSLSFSFFKSHYNTDLSSVTSGINHLYVKVDNQKVSKYFYFKFKQFINCFIISRFSILFVERFTSFFYDKINV